jgi:hypothetical protein
VSRAAHRIPHRPGEVHIATEGPAGVDLHGGHALVAARAGVWIRGFADFRLLGVIELPARGDAQVVEALARKGGAVSGRVFLRAPARDAFIAEEPRAHDEVRAHGVAHRLVDLEGEPQARVSVAAVPIGARVRGREKRRHGVRVGVMQLDAVETRGVGAGGGGGEEPREPRRQLGDVRQVGIRHALAVTVLIALPVPGREHAAKQFIRRGDEACTDDGTSSASARESSRRSDAARARSPASTARYRPKNASFVGRRRMARKSMSWT